MKVDRRFINGFLVTNSYTLGRSMDLAQENAGIDTPIDFDLSGRGPTPTGCTTTCASAVYELPFGPRSAG
jgi:hypothetical protein